jgi:bifunctional ADP-heptose synthase (sugar kinase/adenylyltransferase)/beta-phosphoglucomutase-like phosphatase (HAD superfamily)
MTRNELQQLLDRIGRIDVAIIGDFCLDAYWFLDPSRAEPSLETGLVTRPVARQQYSLGGAGNVAMNLTSLGVRTVHAFGVTGDDPFGPHMVRLLRGGGIRTDGMLLQRDGWSTHVYAKPHMGDQEQNRIDFGDANALDDETADQLVASLASVLPALHAVIINEQVRSGIHASARFRERLSALIGASPSALFILDSRHMADAYEGVIHKLNDHEALRICGRERDRNAHIPEGLAIEAAEELHRRWSRTVFLTRGNRGCLIADGAGVQSVPGLHIVRRVDPVGAGDSMLAGIAAALGAGYDGLRAATLGNFAAGVTVQKLFITGTASPQEIMAIGAEPEYVYRPDLADDPRQARQMPESDIEIVTELPEGRTFKNVIFDHDGTLSVLRQGWESIMEPTMVRAIFGNRHATAEPDLLARVTGRVREYIDKTTGIQTITQMEGLSQMVKEFCLVPEREILDARGYKALYDAQLDGLVEDRLQKLRRGELSREDFAIKGAHAILEALSAAGMTLYLASGSDQDDVRREAEALGYARLFTGGIHGSIGVPELDAKRIVLERILREVGSGAGLLVFGDGPVEIRETHKAGGYAVGIASDEVRRFGRNLSKRSRLIRAGADLVIPDFSQIHLLLPFLGITRRSTGP